MRPGRWWRAACPAPLLLAALAAASGLGCGTFKYFDVHVTFDGATGNFDTVVVSTVNHCVMTVTGADSGRFPLPNGRCPNRTGMGNSLDGGIYEFSTLSDSGTLKFTVEAFQGTNESDACKLGSGTVSATVSTMMTVTKDLSVEKVGAGCI